MMVENFPNWAKDINLQIKESQKTPKKINSKKSMLRYVMSNFWKLKTDKSILKATTEEQYLWEKPFKWQQISHQNPWRPEESGTAFFHVLKEKFSIQNSMHSENVLQKWKRNQDIVRRRKTICDKYIYPERITEKYFLNRKEVIKNLGKSGNNKKCTNTSRYDSTYTFSS